MSERPIEIDIDAVFEANDDDGWGPLHEALTAFGDRVSDALDDRFDGQVLATMFDFSNNRLLIEWIGLVPRVARALVELERHEGQRFDFVSADPSRGEDEPRWTAVTRAMSQLSAAGFNAPQGGLSDDGDAIEILVERTTSEDTQRAEAIARSLEKQSGYQVRLEWTDDPPVFAFA